MKRIVLAVSGASGLLLAQTLISSLLFSQAQASGGLEVHLLVSEAARQVAASEQGGVRRLEEMARQAHAVHGPKDFSAPMASGSWRHDGMIICPCSMSTLAAVANGTGQTLMHRAADVCLKERFPLVLVARETPLSAVHLDNMLKAVRAGAVVMPPVPAYYARPSTLEEAAVHFSSRVLDQLGIEGPAIKRWQDS